MITSELTEDLKHINIKPELEQMIREIHAELCGEKEELREKPTPNGVGVSLSEGSINFYDGEKIVHYDPSKNVKLSEKLNVILYYKPWLSKEECESLKYAISIIEQYESIPEGYIQCIYNPEEYMLVARVK
jgi:hypothetical protein